DVAGENAAVLRALLAQQAGQATGVDAADADDIVLAKVFRQRLPGAPVRMQARHVTHDQPGDRHRGGLDVQRVHAGIADVRIGEGDDLLAVGKIGEYLLVAGHGSVEHHLSHRDAIGADGCSPKHAAVLEHEDGGFELGRLAQVDLHNVVANTGPLRATAGPGEKRVMNPVSDALPPGTRYPGQPGSGPARMRKAGWIVDPSRFRKNAKNGANSTEGAVRCPRRAGLLASEPK